MQTDLSNSVRATEVASAGLFGDLVLAGEIRIGEEERAETVTGLLVRCDVDTIRNAPTLPMYRPVVVLSVAMLHNLLQERDRLLKECDRLAAWLKHIEGGDNPCLDESQLRQWAYEATTLGHDSPNNGHEPRAEGTLAP